MDLGIACKLSSQYTKCSLARRYKSQAADAARLVGATVRILRAYGTQRHCTVTLVCVHVRGFVLHLASLQVQRHARSRVTGVGCGGAFSEAWYQYRA